MQNTAEFNHNDFADTSDADKSLMVKFFYKNVQNQMETAKQGHPVFKEKLYIEIRIAGQRDVQACRPATHADKQRFPRHLEAFEKRVEPPTEGMPLVEWPKMTRTMAEELSFLNVKTVEQLASMKDSNLSQMMGGYGLRDKAVEWLAQNSKDTVDREKEEMREELAALKAQMALILSSKDIVVEVIETPETLQSALDDADTEIKLEAETAVEEKPKAAPRARKSRAKPKT